MNCTYLNETKNLRLFLHDNFYSREEIIRQIQDTIPEYFDVFIINYIPETHTFKIKIKKTNMKKNNSNYAHDTMYYYELLNTIFCTIFNNNAVLIQELIRTQGSNYGLQGHEIQYLLNPNTVFGVYNVTTLLDNILVINL